MYSIWIRFIIADLKKCGITSLAHQWILWMGAVRTRVLTAHKDMFLYTLHKTDGLESCGYSDPRRHPFTADDPLVSK